jgi:hypothetical protein
VIEAGVVEAGVVEDKVVPLSPQPLLNTAINTTTAIRPRETTCIGDVLFCIGPPAFFPDYRFAWVSVLKHPSALYETKNNSYKSIRGQYYIVLEG